jgi:D-tyrosyl-tRNA(Tyr) deacylase
MRAVVQRVSRAEVSVGGKCVGRIGPGFAVLLGVARDDGEADAEFIADASSACACSPTRRAR